MQRTLLNFEASHFLAGTTIIAASFGAAAYVVRSFKLKFIEQRNAMIKEFEEHKEINNKLIKKTEEQVENRQKLVDVLEKENTKLKTENTQLKSEIAGLRELITTNKKKIKTLKRNNKDLNETVRELRAENADLQEKVRQLGEEVNNSKQQMLALEEKLTQDMAELRKSFAEPKQAHIHLEPEPNEVLQHFESTLPAEESASVLPSLGISLLSRGAKSTFSALNSFFSPNSNLLEKDVSVLDIEEKECLERDVSVLDIEEKEYDTDLEGEKIVRPYAAI